MGRTTAPESLGQPFNLDWFPEGVEAPPPVTARMQCPRLFVSHRSSDKEMALRIAWLATREGWDYWIDVLDPNLVALRRRDNLGSLMPEQQVLAAAAIVEFALLNCSHLIAVMTNDTRGSMWVPYEYGRVKEPAPLSYQVSCWRHPQLKACDCPEYLVLAPVHLTEHEIVSWLQWELRIWRQKTQGCRNGAGHRGSSQNLIICRAVEEDEIASAAHSRSLTSPKADHITIKPRPGVFRIGGIELPIEDYHG